MGDGIDELYLALGEISTHSTIETKHTDDIVARLDRRAKDRNEVIYLLLRARRGPK